MGRDQNDIEHILQTCLDEIQSGQGSIDSVIDRFPELADELRPQLEAAVWVQQHGSELDPRPGFVAASRRRLMEQIKKEAALHSAEGSPSWEGWVQKLLFYWNTRLRQVSAPVAVVGVLVLSLFVISGGVVLAAQGSLPGDRLYPVKIATEKVTLAVTMDETRDAELALEYTQRRSEELHQLVIQGRYEDINETVENYESQVEETLEQIVDIDNGQAGALARSLQDILSDQNLVFTSIYETTQGTAKEAIGKAMDVSEDGVERAEVLIRENSNEPDPTPTRTLAPLSTRTATPTRKPNPTATRTPEPPTPTSAPTQTPVPTDRPVPTDPPTATEKSPTRTPVPIVEDTPTRPPTETLPPTPTRTPTPEPTDTSTPTNPPTDTRTPTPEPTDTPSPTDEPIRTPTPADATNTPLPTWTATPDLTTTITDTITTTAIPPLSTTEFPLTTTDTPLSEELPDP